MSSLSKIFEKVINKRFIDFIKKYDVISDYQFGFREGMSTTLALANICDQFQNALDNNEITCGIFIDLTKAFDTVNHSILLKKLKHCCIRQYFSSLFFCDPKLLKTTICKDDCDSNKFD